MFSGGIIIGSAITTLIALNTGDNHTTQHISFNQPTEISQEKQIAVQPEEITSHAETLIQTSAPVENQILQEELSKEAMEGSPSAVNQNTNSPATAQFISGKDEPNLNQKNLKTENEMNEQANQSSINPAGFLIAFSDETTGETETVDPVVDDEITTSHSNASLLYELPEPKTDDEEAILIADNTLHAIDDNPQPVNSKSDVKNDDKKAEEEKKKSAAEKENKAKEKTASEMKDKKPLENENKEAEKITVLDKIFDKSTGEQEVANENIAMDTATKKPDAYINRYAQLSFFTPLSTNGIDSYKYKHYVSFNIIQGFNGAVNGAEFGGVLNLDKGYMTGGQFAGVANLVGGDVTGFQGAGVLNLSNNVKGFQGAGVLNTVVGNMTGFQGAGVMNIAVKKLNGFQAAGVLNINTSLDTATFWQAAGVVNFSIAHSTGAQTAGVLNIANDHTGAQIGLVNFSKKITGTQIGLINIADSIDGAAIGLLSFSRNGIFDIDISTNDFMPLNAAVRVGGPLIYNIFTFGITPSADTATYAYGLGIGGEIPFDKFYVDIDAIGWNVHKDNFEFNYEYFHMNNQLRVTPGYKINKFISVYAGPVVNVEIYDNAIVPLHTNPIRDITGSAFTTNISAGYVAGIRFF